MTTQLLNADNVVFGCYITGVYDVNRTQTLANDTIEAILPWINSIIARGVAVVVFQNGLSKSICEAHQNELVTYINVPLQAEYSPNVMRYFYYDAYLKKYPNWYSNVFITDVTDVVMLRNPFEQALYINKANGIFCGDEPTTLNNEWMVAHHEHIRNTIPHFNVYELDKAKETLLNCGIIGANTTTMVKLLSSICDAHRKYNRNNKTAYTGDMGIFNYVVRNYYKDNLIHGAPVNTVFKAYDIKNTNCWFAHK